MPAGTGEPRAPSARGEHMSKIGVAISGGGHRAALYGLGVLVYLADAGRNRDVRAISSVSGGSITNAYVGLHCDYPAQSAAGFRSVAAGLASQIANRGTLFAWVGTRLYLAALILGGAATFAVWLLPWHWALRLASWLLAVLAWDAALLRRRGRVCGRSYAATLFAGPGTPLAAIDRDRIDHVVCATHLNAGEHVYLSGGFVYAWRFGWGKPGDLPLHVAVQASTALPGAFPPRWLRSSRFGFVGGAGPLPRWVALADGGVYDNMADQWLSGIADRTGVPERVHRPDVTIIANASASMQMQGVGALRLPVLGEVAALLRDSSIMYDNSASIRKSDLVGRFDATGPEDPPDAPGTGALLDIASDPFAAAEAFAASDATRPGRARRAREALAMRPPGWESDAGFVASVATNLSRLGVETAARIMRHGYAVAAMNLHVFLGFPLLGIPPLEEFEELCR